MRRVFRCVCGAAAGYYNYILGKTDRGKRGIEYFDKRSISPEIINTFKLGYVAFVVIEKWNLLCSIR
jgi:hypothetical protein